MRYCDHDPFWTQDPSGALTVRCRNCEAMAYAEEGIPQLGPWLIEEPSGFDLTRAEREKLRIYQAERVVVGHCPECSAVLVLLNDRESWPPAICGCGWAGGSTDLLNHIRHERGGYVFPEVAIRWKRRELWRSAVEQGADADLAAQARMEAKRWMRRIRCEGAKVAEAGWRVSASVSIAAIGPVDCAGNAR